ncbi:MAG: hypothetical protein HYY17_05295 [Planctomycetes bacterium]|nr:hypothetical protein [Planctomycetota bacterium]
MTCLRFLLTLLAWTSCGAGITALGTRRALGRAEFLALSFALGLGFAGFVHVALMLVGVRVGLWVAIAVAPLGLIALRVRPVFVPSARPPLLAWFGHAVALGAIGVMSWAASLNDTVAGDGEEFWTLKTKSIVRFGTFRNPDFTGGVRPHRHSGYPLLMPSAYASLRWTVGTAEGWPVRYTLALFFAAASAILAGILRERLGASLAAWLTAFFAWLPMLLSPRGGLLNAYSDFPLAIFILIGVVEGFRWLTTLSPRSGFLSAVALACASQCKDEGGAFVSACMILFPLTGLLRGKRAAFAATLIPLAGFVTFLAWTWAKRSFVPDREAATASAGIEWSRIPRILYNVVWLMVKANKWSLGWLFVGGMLALRFPKPREPESLLTSAAGAILLIYVAVWTVIPAAEADEAMGCNAPRILMHFFPLLFVWASWRLATVLPQETPRPRIEH